MIGVIDFRANSPALIVEGQRRISYRELGERVGLARDLLRKLPRPAFVFQFTPNSADAVAAYLACLEEGIPLGMGEASEAARSRVIAAYRPTALWLPSGESAPNGYSLIGALTDSEVSLWARQSGYEFEPNARLALLLATSGSTGDAKCVRLSSSNLQENASSISEYLEIFDTDVAALSLPLFYSYGLSVINSHLIKGAAVMLTKHSFMRPEFWRCSQEAACTSFPGVPYMYETMFRLRIDPGQQSYLRTLTQAGGHLRPEVVQFFNDSIRERGGRMFVMYGQTEATARISYVPPEKLASKLGTIGIPIPNGRLWLEEMEDEGANHRQLYYSGPNVMLGYANGPSDLTKGDELGGVLATGDVAEMDADGFFRITGRLARIAKIFGKRVNLASIETEVEKLWQIRAAALESKDGIRVFIEGGSSDVTAIRAHLSTLLGVPPSSTVVTATSEIPLTGSGKKNYKALL